jgi:pyruvate/2-oxoacid:ferredoxin oxidoreductase alpha subunit
MSGSSGNGNGKSRFPGIPTITDGSGAVVWVEVNITQAACAYPITSSTVMGGGYSAAVSNGQKNLWGEKLLFIEPESEHSSASTCEGFALAGGRVTNFTSGQGLVLMKEVLYTISGKRLPIVFHIGARALTSHSLNVHAGHDDVMSVADTGWGILFGRNPQEACDLALIARRAAEKCQSPFMNVQDGFLITHTIENVLLPEKEFMQDYVGIVRNEADMRRALERIERLRGEASHIAVTGHREYNPGWHTALDLRCMLIVSEAITRAAIERKESRGAQFREDYPEKSAEFAKVHTIVWKGDDGAMQIRREEILPIRDDLKRVIEEMK